MATKPGHVNTVASYSGAAIETCLSIKLPFGWLVEGSLRLAHLDRAMQSRSMLSHYMRECAPIFDVGPRNCLPLVECCRGIRPKWEVPLNGTIWTRGRCQRAKILQCEERRK
jgi:hypothetical protein